MAASAQYDMPKTNAGAPPNFYNQVGKMAAAGGAAGQQVPGQPQPGQQPPAAGADSQKFIEMTQKLLTVLAAMQSMKPNGMDVTKYTQAAADSMKTCLKDVLNGENGQAPGSDPTAADTGQMPGDQTGQSTGAGDASGAGAGGAGVPG